MNKHNSFIKKIIKQILSINNLIESYFNRIRNLKLRNLISNNRVFFGFSAAVILTLSYFLLPTIHNKDVVRLKIQNHIDKKYDFKIKFNEKIRYGLLPKPHFTTKNLSIMRGKNEIGLSKNFKVFIGLNKLFFIEDIKIKDLVFKGADFKMTKEDLSFFFGLLKTEPNANNIIFKNNNIFFKGKDDKILFLNKVYNGKFSYDSYNLENNLVSRNEIFNIPYKLVIKNNKYNQDFLTVLSSKKIRLDIENYINYESQIKDGSIEISFVNKNTTIEYKLKKNSLVFNTKNMETLKGFMDFKPFYFSANFNHDGLSTKNLFNTDSIFVNLIKSNIFNNKNINANIDVNIKKITNINELNNLFLKINLEEGLISLEDSSINWKDDLKIVLTESFLSNDSEGINLIGKINLDFNNLDALYKSFQIQKKNRKKIKKIEIDLIYNFDQNKIRFDNPRVDGEPNSKLENYIKKFNSKENTNFNKITFKNFINKFFKAYAG
mgnify:CR=1 FL=1